MVMTERTLVNYTLRHMKGRWIKPIKHADAFTAGIADLSAYIAPAGNIWIEVKALKRWPVRDRTVVEFGFTDLQRDFIMARKGWLWCRVAREYLLFDHNVAWGIVDTPSATREFLRAHATRVWHHKVNWEEFSTCVQYRYD